MGLDGQHHMRRWHLYAAQYSKTRIVCLMAHLSASVPTNAIYSLAEMNTARSLLEVDGLMFPSALLSSGNRSGYWNVEQSGACGT